MPAMGAAATPLRGLFAAEAAPTEGVERLLQKAWSGSYRRRGQKGVACTRRGEAYTDGVTKRMGC
jgi:hypothetical protein